MARIASSWQVWSLAFELRAEVSSHFLSDSSALERARAELEDSGARILEPSPESFRFRNKVFTLRRKWSVGSIAAGKVRAQRSGEHTVVTISGSFIVSLLSGLIFSFVCVALGWPLYFVLGMVAFVLILNGVVAYSALRQILTRVVQPSSTSAP
jgi:Flp pilus assembly protein TadB